MTTEEAKIKSQEKLKAIEMFLKQMQVEVTAEQMVTKEGFIKNIIYYSDIEKYAIEDPKQDDKKDSKPLKEFTEEATGIRGQDTPASLRVRPGDVGSSEAKEFRTEE